MFVKIYFAKFCTKYLNNRSSYGRRKEKQNEQMAIYSSFANSN